MSNETQIAFWRRIVNRLKRVEREKVSWCQAVVTDNEPLTIKLNGSDTEVRVQGIDGLGYDVNAVVTVLVRDADMLALGASTDAPGGSVTYAAGDGLDLSGGIFSLDLKPSAGLTIDGTELAVAFGTSAGTVCQGNDSRLSDQRTPSDNSVTSAKIVDGTIVDADIASGAAIGGSKIALNSLNGNRIVNTSIDNSKVSASAAIDQSKIANLTTDLASKAAKAGDTYTGAHNFTGATAVTVPTADASSEAVPLAQMQTAIAEAEAGYRRLPDVDAAGFTWNFGGSSLELPPHTRSGNVLSGSTTSASSLTASTYPLSLNDSVLVLRETTNPEENGIYTLTQEPIIGVQSWELTRRSDADADGDLKQYDIVRDANSGYDFKLVTADPIVINSTAQDWDIYYYFPVPHEDTHVPSGTDPLPTDTPVSVGTANSEGTADSFARSDHVHAREPYGAKAYNSSALTIATGTSWVALTFNSETYDYGGFHSTSSNTGRMTAPADGFYTFSFTYTWSSNSTGQRASGFRKNGSTFLASQYQPAFATSNGMISFTDYLSAGDYVEVMVWQTSGGNLDLAMLADYSGRFTIARVG